MVIIKWEKKSWGKNKEGKYPLNIFMFYSIL